MIESKTFFRYCICCGDKFTPSKQGRKCKKCKEKVITLTNLERIKNSLDKIINPPKDFFSPERLPLEKKHLTNLKEINKKMDEEIKLLKLELKV